jgi:hypothetical protein
VGFAAPDGRYAPPVTRQARAGGATDATGIRNEALDSFLETKLREGFEVESRRDTHAIIVERGQLKSVLSRIRGRGANRFVVSVDENGEVTMIPAEPKRS